MRIRGHSSTLLHIHHHHHHHHNHTIHPLFRFLHLTATQHLSDTTTPTSSTPTATSADTIDYAATHAPLHVLRLSRIRCTVPAMLQIEEMLLRGDNKNWLVFNRPPAGYRTIVTGISGNVPVLVNAATALKDDLSVIRRFSGGGTVYIDDNTWFACFIISQQSLPGLNMWPRHLMRFTADAYAPLFGPPHGGTSQFTLRDNDYCFADRKFGGNAQSIVKGRWLHHTSFLHKVDTAAIERYLAMPSKQPDYRKQRGHSEFIVPMSDILDEAGRTELNEMSKWEDALIDSLRRWFVPTEACSSLEPLPDQHHNADSLITNEMIDAVPLLRDVAQVQREGKYTLGTKRVDLQIELDRVEQQKRSASKKPSS